jgi:hypothetical protein
MIAEELQNRNRLDIAESYEVQSPTNIHANRNENTDSNAPTLNNVSSSKTILIHDKSMITEAGRLQQSIPEL